MSRVQLMVEVISRTLLIGYLERNYCLNVKICKSSVSPLAEGGPVCIFRFPKFLLKFV